VTNWYDADDPPVLASEFATSDWSSVDISTVAPPGIASGLLISARPVGESLPSVKLAIKSSTDEILVDSFLSRANPALLRLDEGDTHIEAMLVEGNRPITIFANGYQFYR
jgi:hypothetical protein